MKTALIGYSGFIGSNLEKQFTFSDKYNSKNISDIKNQEYDLVVCCGIQASMWFSNNFPKEDLENIISLLTILKTVKIKKFILISSVAVFSQSAINVDENSCEFEKNSFYGKNRRYAEEFIKQTFENHLIIRLPALFGNSLKKNFIYDLLNQEPAFIPEKQFMEILAQLNNEEIVLLKNYYNFNAEKLIYNFDKNKAIADKKRANILKCLNKAQFTALKFTNSKSIFQFYNLDNLWRDIQIAIKNNLETLHLCSYPLEAQEIAKDLLGIDFNNSEALLVKNNLETRYAKLWQKDVEKYQYSKLDIIRELKTFMEMSQSKVL